MKTRCGHGDTLMSRSKKRRLDIVSFRRGANHNYKRNAKGVRQTLEADRGVKPMRRVSPARLHSDLVCVPPPSRCCRQEATEALRKIHKPAAVNS